MPHAPSSHARFLRLRRGLTIAFLLWECVQLSGCFVNFTERDGAELGTSFLEFFAMPTAAAGPQPFAGPDGEVYYCNRGDVRTLRDDALVARVEEPLGLGLLRVAKLGDCQLLGLAVHDVDPMPTVASGFPRTLSVIDGTGGCQRSIRLELPVVDMATAPQSGDLLFAIECDESQGRVNPLFGWSGEEDGSSSHRFGVPGPVDSKLVYCDRSTGAPIRGLEWEVRDLRGLDCTPDGRVVVCGGVLGEVQGVYVGTSEADSRPALLERDVALPSIRADGRQVAMLPCDPTRTCDLGRFRDAATVRLVDLDSGARREIPLGKDVLVCALRYVEQPTRLLATGMRSDRSGKHVEWVIWSILDDGHAQVLRSWKYERGNIVLDEVSG